MDEETEKREYERIEECETCNDCLCWHKHCFAECCKIFKITNGPGLILDKKFLKISVALTPSRKRYYELRDCKYVHGILMLPMKNIRMMKGYMWYVQPCNLLKDNLCLGHPDRKPKLCRDLTLETAGAINCTITPNCLFKYKKVELYKYLITVYSEEDLALFEELKRRR